MNFEEKTVYKEKIFKGKILNLELHDVILPDGNVAKREILYHKGASAVLARTVDKKILLIKQFRKPIENITLEIPAGKFDYLGEDPVECAIRELREETGYIIEKKDLKQIISTHVAVGYSSELIHIYFADNLSIKKEQKLDNDEFVECKEYEQERVFSLLKNGHITDAKTIIALQWLENKEKI